MLNLRKPAMIIFDYGQTLLGETEYDILRGNRALLEYAVKNPRGLSAEDVHAYVNELFGQICVPLRRGDREPHEYQFMRLWQESLQLEFSIPIEEQERIFCAACIRAMPMPYIQALLDYLAEQNIRTAVLSNIMSSGLQLRERIDSHLPGHHFEFFIASSEYGIRKPDPLIFQLACAKADLPPEQIWFCGDNPRCDVDGSATAGMTPVWYEELTIERLWADPTHPQPLRPHVHIHDWRELIAKLETL